MQLIRGLSNIRTEHRGAILTIGNFDGVHLGHQALLKTLIERGQAEQKKTMVMVFEPSPQEFFQPQNPPPRLSRFIEKARLMAPLGVDYLLKINFNQNLSQLSAHDFIDQILVKHLNIHEIMVGDDFQFGYQRQGTIDTLVQTAKRYHYTVRTFQQQTQNAVRISSSQIRQSLRAGNLSQAKQLLGRHYSMTGRVVHGAKRGRLLGVPTANILPKRRTCPLSGVFLVTVNGITEQALPAVAHIGAQPTVDNERELLEVHLLDFTDDLYGRLLTIEFIKKVREIENFPDLDTLTKAMNQDILVAKDFFHPTE